MTRRLKRAYLSDDTLATRLAKHSVNEDQIKGFIAQYQQSILKTWGFGNYAAQFFKLMFQNQSAHLILIDQIKYVLVPAPELGR